jgi:hypothetical protein
MSLWDLHIFRWPDWRVCMTILPVVRALVTVCVSSHSRRLLHSCCVRMRWTASAATMTNQRCVYCSDRRMRWSSHLQTIVCTFLWFRGLSCVWFLLCFPWSLSLWKREPSTHMKLTEGSRACIMQRFAPFHLVVRSCETFGIGHRAGAHLIRPRSGFAHHASFWHTVKCGVYYLKNALS